MMADNTPPPEVQRAAAIVDAWLDSQKKPATTAQPVERAVDRFARTPRSDVPPQMPAWRDPRK
jgi:hypothetical protein